MKDFSGVKIALIVGNKIIAILRDNKPNINFPGQWDLPGGARERKENPFECAQREIEEELAIKIDSKNIVWQRIYPAMHDPNLKAYFMVVKINQQNIEKLKFGDEGQEWKLTTIPEFLEETNAIKPIKDRLKDYLEHTDY